MSFLRVYKKLALASAAAGAVTGMFMAIDENYEDYKHNNKYARYHWHYHPIGTTITTTLEVIATTICGAAAGVIIFTTTPITVPYYTIKKGIEHYK